jgi:hypothetical protein
MTAITAIAGVASIAGEGFSLFSSSEANTQKQYALQMQLSQTQAKAAQDSIARNEKMQQISSTALALQGASGMTLNSGNYTNAQNQAYNSFAKDNQIADMNLESDEDSIKSAMDAANQNYHVNMFNDFASIAKQGANLISFDQGKESESDAFLNM